MFSNETNSYVEKLVHLHWHTNPHYQLWEDLNKPSYTLVSWIFCPSVHRQNSSWYLGFRSHRDSRSWGLLCRLSPPCRNTSSFRHASAGMGLWLSHFVQRPQSWGCHIELWLSSPQKISHTLSQQLSGSTSAGCLHTYPVPEYTVGNVVWKFIPCSMLILASDWLTLKYGGVSHVWRHQHEI